MEPEKYFVWDNGHLKVLVYERKFNFDEKCYEEFLRIDEPKARAQ